jgi:hypothetical protein
MTRSEADRRVAELEADWATLELVDPIRNHHREVLLR